MDYTSICSVCNKDMLIDKYSCIVQEGYGNIHVNCNYVNNHYELCLMCRKPFKDRVYVSDTQHVCYSCYYNYSDR